MAMAQERQQIRIELGSNVPCKIVLMVLTFRLEKYSCLQLKPLLTAASRMSKICLFVAEARKSFILMASIVKVTGPDKKSTNCRARMNRLALTSTCSRGSYVRVSVMWIDTSLVTGIDMLQSDADAHTITSPFRK